VGEHFIIAIYNGASNWADSHGLYLDYMVLSAQQELAVIIDQVNALVTAGTLSSGNGNALITKLNNAITSLNWLARSESQEDRWAECVRHSAHRSLERHCNLGPADLARWYGGQIDARKRVLRAASSLWQN